MVDPVAFCQSLRARGVRFFAGVPDSLLKSFCACVADTSPPGTHVVAANEGNAVALAAGHHLATGGVGVAYMQNSGLGNAVNPLASLADPEVYRIPLLLVVGWRGEPGVKDEPQHVKQGRITPGLLDLLEIPHRILEADSDANALLDDLFASMAQTGAPAALLVRKNAFADYKAAQKPAPLGDMAREDALAQILDLLPSDALVVSTTGKTSRELFELRARRGESQRDFLTVGSMGHTSSIALGVALAAPDRRVVCLDGDGSLLMHLGSMPVAGSLAPKNFLHVLLNNGAHESVGGQPTVADHVDFARLAPACGFAYFGPASSPADVASLWRQIADAPGPALLEIRLRCGSRPDLGRPTSTAQQNKIAFMEQAHATLP
jgi:phosphonopyruvate decarboxylase